MAGIAFPLLLVLLAPAGQDGSDLKSGPQAGQDIPGPFECLNLSGAHLGNQHCLICANGLNPVVAIFSRGLPAPDGQLAQLVQKIDVAAQKDRKQKLGCFLVALTGDIADEATRDQLIRRGQDLATALNLKEAVLAAYAPEGPEKLRINKDADITIFLYRKHKVQSSFAFAKDKLAEKDVAAVLSAMASLLASE